MSDFERAQLDRRLGLIDRGCPDKGIGKDIWNLEYLCAGIHENTGYYRSGMMRSLRRAIKIMRAMEREVER